MPGETITDKPFALSGLLFANHVQRLALPSSCAPRPCATRRTTHPARHRITCCSPSGTCMSSRDGTTRTCSPCRASGWASMRSGLRDSYSSRVPQSSRLLWPRAPPMSSRASLARLYVRSRSTVAGQSWMATWGSRREHWHAKFLWFSFSFFFFS